MRPRVTRRLRPLVAALSLVAGALGATPDTLAGPALPDLAVSQTVAVSGSAITFTLRPTLVAPWNAPLPIHVAEPLPAGLLYASASGAGWLCAGTTGGLFPAGAQTAVCTRTIGATTTVPAPLGLITIEAGLAPGAQLDPALVSCAYAWGGGTNSPNGTLASFIVAVDATPADNRSCLGPVSKATGTLCARTWHDRDANGVRASSEPDLAGRTYRLNATTSFWTGSLVAKKAGSACRVVPAGSYSVTEVSPAGWRQTKPAAGAPALVAVGAGQTASVDFGDVRERCCLSTVFLAGLADNFKPTGVEPALMVPGANSSVSVFDWSGANKRFTHRIVLPPDQCIESARYEIRLKAVGPTSKNDTLLLKVGGVSWVRNLNTLSTSASPPYPWSAGKPARTYSWNIAALSSANNTPLLPALRSARQLDTWVDNDTSVDFIRLTVTFCECAP